MSNNPNKLQRYHIIETIGQGGSSVVFYGFNSIGKKVAIKFQRRPKKRIRFLQEYQILNEFPHPSLVQIYEYGMLNSGWSYLVLQLLEGKSATGFVRTFVGMERLKQCVEIAACISEACGTLHQRGWIHGDIKSKNILIDLKGLPYLIDFELARSLDSTGQRKFFGTRSYAPPEQHEGRKLTTSVDVYAMAGVLHRMITNKLPFERVDNAKEAKMRRNTPPNISKKLPSALRELLIRALHPDPSQRPADGHTFAKELRECLNIQPQIHQYTPEPPPIFHAQITLHQNHLSPELHLLDLLSLTGNDNSLMSLFAYHRAHTDRWVPQEYEEQVWSDLNNFPHSIQRALFFLACVGGCAPTDKLYKFANISRKGLFKVFQALPHWVSRHDNMWHLFVGAIHPACLQLFNLQEERIVLLEIQKGLTGSVDSLGYQGRLFIDALFNPNSVIEPAKTWIYTHSNTLLQWRLLQRLKTASIHLLGLEQLLKCRRNGDWITALGIQQTDEANDLLALYEDISPNTIQTLHTLLKHRNIDVAYSARLIISEWYILHGQFQLAESFLKPLCQHKDAYPRLLGLQQQALIHHHLDQRSAFEMVCREIDAIATYRMSDLIRQLIHEDNWQSNVIPIQSVDSLYLKVLKAFKRQKDPNQLIAALSQELSINDRALLSAHHQWIPYVEALNLPKEPEDEEFIYQNDPEEDF